ncbi:MAG: 1,4-dihydroxy-2-naphthoate polyprenyltransferase [Verrucomicrobiales bacterium]
MQNLYPPGDWRCWLLAARLPTLFAAWHPVVLGTVVAIGLGSAQFLYAGVALVAALLIQVATNFANDYFDWKKGADNEARLGPPRVCALGLLPPQTVWRATWICLGLASVLGAVLIWRGGWPILLIGVVSLACGILYTAGRYALAYLGLGDIFVLIFFGPVASGGTFYVQALTWDPWSLVLGVNAGLYSVALLAINNWRDVEQDRQADKRTLAVRFGARFAWQQVQFCLMAPILILMLPILAGRVVWQFSVAPLLLLPLTVLFLREVPATLVGRQINPLLPKVGRLALAHMIIVSVAWIFTAH